MRKWGRRFLGECCFDVVATEWQQKKYDCVPFFFFIVLIFLFIDVSSSFKTYYLIRIFQISQKNLVVRKLHEAGVEHRHGMERGLSIVGQRGKGGTKGNNIILKF